MAVMNLMDRMRMEAGFPSLKRQNKDGGPGSGNFGHAGVPGQVGGSAPGPFGKLSDDAVAIIKAHLNSPMHFGETDEQKAASQKTLVESLKKSGISVSYDEDKYPWPYRALSTDLTYQENLQMNQALNQTQWVAGVNREQYIDACREAGKEPRLSETPFQVSEWALYSKSGKLQSDGTPVYSSLDKESLLSDADLIEYAGNDSYLSPEKNEAAKKAAASAIENMTEAQLKACHNYSKQFSSTNYQAINDYLATGQGSPEAAEAAKQMTEALDRSIGAPCICSRGAAGFFGTENDAAISKLVAKVAKGDFSAAGKLKAALEGKTLSSKTVMSTSPGDALDGFDKAPVQMIFKVPANAKGVNITAVSAFGGGRSEVEKKLAATGMFGAVSHESEVAFKPGTRYTIERVEYALSTDGKKKKGQVYVVASILPETSNNDGGPGSGNFGHSGVPGQVGGSAPGNGSRAVVNGSDISRSYKGKPDIKSVMEAQGFTGLPKVVSKEEFDKAVKASSFIAQRVYSASSQEVLDAYRNQLYNGDWYVECETGGAQYGQGMYCAADYNGKLTDGIKSEMESYRQREKKMPSGSCSYIETMTLDPSAKIVSFDDLRKEQEACAESVRSEVNDAFSYNEEWQNVAYRASLRLEARPGDKETYRKLQLTPDYRAFVDEHLEEWKDKRYEINSRAREIERMDNGAFAAMRGYDAINAEDGASGSYTVILNRTKTIILDGNGRQDAKDDSVIFFQLGSDGVIYAIRAGKVIGWVSAGMSDGKNSDSSEKPLDFKAQSATIKSKEDTAFDGAPKGNQNAAGPHKGGGGNGHKLSQTERTKLENRFVGKKSSKGTEVKKFSEHAFDRLGGRGISAGRFENMLNSTDTKPDKNHPDRTLYDVPGSRLVLANDGTVVSIMWRRQN